MSARDPMLPADPDYAAAVRRNTLGMPIARMFGVEFTVVEPGHVEALLRYREDLGYKAGHFQGVAVSAVAYFAAASAIGTLLPADRVAMTLDQTVKFLAPAAGERLVARGRTVSAGRSVGVGAADVYAVRDGRETLCATALVTSRNVKRPSTETP